MPEFKSPELKAVKIKMQKFEDFVSGIPSGHKGSLLSRFSELRAGERKKLFLIAEQISKEPNLGVRINALLALNSLLLNPQFNEKMLDKFKSISDLLLRESDTAVKLNAFSTFSILLSNKNCNPPLMLCFEQIATNLLKFKDDSIRVMAFSHIMPLLGNTSLECEMLEKLNDVVSRIREYETEKASAYKFFEVLGSLLRNRGFEASMLDDFGSIVISLKTGEDSGAKKPLFTAFLTLLDNKAFDANLMSGLVRLTQKLCPFAGGSISNAVFSALNGFCENPRLDSKNVEQIERIFDKIMNEITPDSYHHELRKDIHLDIFTSMEGLLKGGPEKGMLDSFERVLDSVFDMPAREVVSCFDLISEMVRHNKLETSMFELLERIITDKLYTKYYDHDPEIEIRENVFQQLGVLVRHKNFEVGMLFDFEKMVRVFSNEPNAQGNVFDAVGALLRNYSLDRMMLASIADTLTIPQLKQLEMEERLNLAYGVSVLGRKNALQLRKERGIEFFIRYSAPELERQMYQINQSFEPDYAESKQLTEQHSKPVFLVIYNHHDYNGAFYGGIARFDALSEHFNVVVFETGNRYDFYEDLIDKTTERYGYPTHYLFGAHGSKESMMYGIDEKKGSLRLDDIEEFRDRYSKVKVSPDRPGPVVILEACLTGHDKEAIGSKIADVLDASRLFAPQEPGSIIDWTVKVIDGEPKVTDVTYSKPKTIFGPDGEIIRKE